MDDVYADGSELVVDGTRVQFDEEIAEFVTVGDIVVVRLKFKADMVDNRNVIGVGNDGAKRWTIQEAPHQPTDDNPYIYISVREEELWARSWHDREYRIDPDSGEVVDEKVVR